MANEWKAMQRKVAKETAHNKIGDLSTSITQGGYDSEERTGIFKALLHTAHSLVGRYNMDMDRAAHVIRPICAKLKLKEYHEIADSVVLISLPNSGILIIATKPYKDRLIPVSALSIDMYIKATGIQIRLALEAMEFKGRGSRRLKQQLKKLMEE